MSLIPISSWANEPLNHVEWNNAKEILVNTKSILEKKGWYRVKPEEKHAHCLATALEESWQELGLSLVDFSYARHALDQAIDAPKSLPTNENDPLSVPYWGRYYMYWNDADDRTEDEVLSAIDKAILISNENVSYSELKSLSGKSLEDFDNKMMQSLGFSK